MIVKDSGQLVDLSSASLKHSPTTPDNAQNIPTNYPDSSVNQFDSTKFKGKDSFDSLVLMIQNSLSGVKFSFVRDLRTTAIYSGVHTHVFKKKIYLRCTFLRKITTERKE